MAKDNKKRFIPNVSVGTGGLDYGALRNLAENQPKEFMTRVNKLIDDGKLSWSSVTSLRDMFHAFADIQVKTDVNVLGRTRSVMASAFPLLSGALTVAAINDSYDAVPTIGEQLVTEMQDNKRSTVLASVTSLNPDLDRVDEGNKFPEISAGEEKYEIKNKRNGRMLSITAEMIEENDVSNIIERVNKLGEIAAETIEEQTLRRVCDIDGSGSSPAEPYVLHLNGSATQLYNATASYPGARAASGTRVNNNALVDETDLENARLVLAAMKNDRGKRINIPMSQCTLLVPDALASTAWRLLGSELTPGTVNEMNPWGPRGAYRPTLLTSTKLDDLSTTVWYLGNFKKQFKRKWKLDFEYVTLSGNTQKFLEGRIAFQARIAWDCEVGAADYVYVVQNLPASTAP